MLTPALDIITVPWAVLASSYFDQYASEVLPSLWQAPDLGAGELVAARAKSLKRGPPSRRRRVARKAQGEGGPWPSLVGDSPVAGS